MSKKTHLSKIYLHLPPFTHKKCPPNPTHPKYTSNHPHPPLPINNKFYPTPTHPKYSSIYPYLPTPIYKSCPPTPTYPEFNDDDELFLRNGWPTKRVKPYFQTRPLSEILTIANLQHALAGLEPEFRLYGMKLCSSGKHYTTSPTLTYPKYTLNHHRPPPPLIKNVNNFLQK